MADPPTYRVPMGVRPYQSGALASGATAPYRARCLVPGVVVGFVCLTPELRALGLQIGGTKIPFSDDGFPSEAAAKPGILFPPMPVAISQDLVVDFCNASPVDVFPRAYFLVDIERTD
jgi:hypothetical protein